MEPEHFIQFLAGITNLTPAFINDVVASLTFQRCVAKQIIKGEGQIGSHFWYLKSGIARSYILDTNQQQHTLRFWTSGEVIFSYAGFLQEPSPEFIEILSDSELYTLSYAKVEQLMRDHPETLKIAGAINRYHIQKDYKRDFLHSLKTRERYLRFRSDSPEIFKAVPLWMIASYLHMTRENLSRVISEA